MAAPFTSTFLYLTGGFVLWALRFLAVYSFTAIACSRGWSNDSFAGIGAVSLGVGLITVPCVLAAAALLTAAITGLRNRSAAAGSNWRFIHYIAASVAALAILAMIWEMLPFAMIPICV